MNATHGEPARGAETDKERLDGLLSTDVLTLDLVSALAGDRPLTQAETLLIEKRRSASGDRFHSELLYAITHQHFGADVAMALWKGILRHKYEMSATLKRNTRVVVAALDYLSNITGDIMATTLISEAHVATIVDSSLRDGLTGLYNHAFFFRRAGLELRRCAAHGAPMSLMMIDIDGFKDYNDRYGHQEGDVALRSVAAIIDAETRETDVCCRYGGEEFGVVLPSTGAAEAALFAERLRKAIEQSRPEERRTTVSIGVAVARGDSPRTVASLVKDADEALYEAKAAGKNRVAVRE